MATKKANNQSVLALQELKNALMNEDNLALAEQVKINNPVKEVEGALSQFLVSKLDHLAKNDEFDDLIKMYIRQRLPEATFEELINLAGMLTKNNNESTRSILSLFKNEASGKIITDNLRDSSLNSTAQQIYDSTDSKDILQAVSYLSQVLGKMQGAVEVSHEDIN